MRRILVLVLIVFTVVMVFFGCGENNIGDYDTIAKDYYDYTTDSQLVNSLSTWNSNIAKSEYGYYILIGKRIYYIEKETMTAVPLCGKPNCMHIDANCNAYVGAVDSICYSNDYIYFVSVAGDDQDFEGAYLTKMSVDGSQKENILYMDIYPTDWIIHRGFFYYSIKKYRFNEYTKLEDINYADCYILRYSTEKSDDESESIYYADEIEKDAQILNLVAYGNNLYFELYGMARDNKSVEVRKSVKMNLKDYSVSEMLSPTGYSLSQPMYLDGMLVFSSGEKNEDKYLYYKTDFNGCNPEYFFETYEGENIVCDGKYLYVDNYYTLSMPHLFPEDDPVNRDVRYITAYDSKLNKIDEFSLGGGSATTWHLFPVDDQLFLFGGESDSGDVIFYYDKNELGTIDGGLWEKTISYRENVKTSSVNDNKPGAISEAEPSGSEYLINIWKEAKNKDYGVKNTFQSEGANAEGGFSIRLIWDQDGGTVTSYFPFLEFESDEKAKEFMAKYPYSLRSDNILVLVGVESIPEEVHTMLSSVLYGEPIEPIDSSGFSGELFSFS